MTPFSRKMFISFIAAASIIGLSGCSSYFKRKECEKTNWFTHGEKIASAGGTLEGDGFINECRKAEADISHAQLDLGFKKGRSEYCKPDATFDLGKKGDKFKESMCEGENMKLLKARYAAGVNEYCAESNGYSAGASGKVYQGVCPNGSEQKFLAKYNKGRIKFLQGEIEGKESTISDLNRQIRDREKAKNMHVLKLAMTPQKQRAVKTVRYDPKKKREIETVSLEDDPTSADAREDIKNDIEREDREIAQKRNEQDALRAEIQKLKSEIRGLEGEG